MKFVHILYEDMIDGCDRVIAVFDHYPTEDEILAVVSRPCYRSEYYVVEHRLITAD